MWGWLPWSLKQRDAPTSTGSRDFVIMVSKHPKLTHKNVHEQRRFWAPGLRINYINTQGYCISRADHIGCTVQGGWGVGESDTDQVSDAYIWGSSVGVFVGSTQWHQGCHRQPAIDITSGRVVVTDSQVKTLQITSGRLVTDSQVKTQQITSGTVVVKFGHNW